MKCIIKEPPLIFKSNLQKTLEHVINNFKSSVVVTITILREVNMPLQPHILILTFLVMGSLTRGASPDFDKIGCPKPSQGLQDCPTKGIIMRLNKH